MQIIQQEQRSGQYFSTNHVLIHKKKQKDITAYMPGYLRVKFKNFLQLDLTNLTSLINATIIFNVYYGDFFDFDQNFQKISQYMSSYQITTQSGDKQKRYKQQTYKQELIELFMTQLKLNFSRDSAILLAQKTDDQENLQIDVKHSQKEQEVKFTVRKTFHVHLDGDLRWSPFQVINSILEITVQPISFKVLGKSYSFKINLMSHPDNQLKLSFGQQKTFAHYGLAVKLAKTAFTNVKIQKSQEFYMSIPERHAFLKQKNPEDYKQNIDKMDKVDIMYFQYAFFNIPMYKFPSSSLVTVFLPLWLLGLINLGIYFQDQKLSDRIGSIIGLMLAFIAYIPTIKQAIPPSANIVFMEGLVYAQSLASLCTFIHSMRIKSVDKFRLIWGDTPEYWITLVITAGSFLMVMVLMIVHYCYWERKLYNEGEDDKLLGMKGIRKLRFNQTCLEELIVNGSFQAPNTVVDNGKKKMFDRKTWSNIACDLYFNRYFLFRKQAHVEKKAKDGKEIKELKQTKDAKQMKDSKDKKQKQKQKVERKNFKEYFIIQFRKSPLNGLDKMFYKNDEQKEEDSESFLNIERKL